MSDEVVLVQALHDDNDATLGLVVEATKKRVLIIFVNTAPLSFGEGLIGLQGIIENDGVGAPPG